MSLDDEDLETSEEKGLWERIGFLRYTVNHHRHYLDDNRKRIEVLEARVMALELKMAKAAGMGAAVGSVIGTVVAFIVISIIKSATGQ